MKLVVIKSNFQVCLVPNYRVFQIIVIYVYTFFPSIKYTCHDQVSCGQRFGYILIVCCSIYFVKIITTR